MAELLKSKLPGGARARRWMLDYPRAMPIVIFLLIGAVTAVSIFSIEAGERDRELAKLREEAQSVASAFERRSDGAAAYLRAGAALFATKGELSREDFAAFVDELRINSNYLGAEGVGWARALAPLQVPAFEAEKSAQFGAPLRVTPRPLVGAARVVPVTYLHPNTERNQRAIGYDMYSESVRRAAMDEAERSVRPTASGRVVLVQEGRSDAPGFLLYMPVFEGLGSSRQLRGFIYSPFNAADFLSSSVQLTPEYNHALRLYDGAPSDDSLLAELGKSQADGLSVLQSVNFANRPMILELEGERGSGLSRLSVLTLAFGLLVAGLLLALIRLLTRQANEDRAALEWLREQDSIRDSLTRELNHRVKNTLANVLSIIALTRHRAERIDDFADALDGRVRALSATHDLLTMSKWGTTPLRDVVEAELAPYLDQSEWVVELNGPPVQLAPNDALSFGLAIHELGTNAARFGALSVVGGIVTLEWDMVADKLVRVVWQERGGPQVSGTRPRGFGLHLIERIVAHELGQPVEIEFLPEGVRCELLVPVRLPSDFALRARSRHP
ncbi:MAG: CHASE domain-containing protein [Sphingomonadaceae bacterium]